MSDWEEETTGGDAAVAVEAPVMAEMPEIKLFGKWSCDGVDIVDMSLQVRPPFKRQSLLFTRSITNDDSANTTKISEQSEVNIAY